MTTTDTTPTPAPQIGDLCRAVVPGRILVAAGDEGADDKPAGYLKALVSAYGVKYRIGYRTWHTIEYGAAAASLAASPVEPWFWMHGWDAFVGTADLPVGDGTFSESEDDGGLVTEGALFVEADPTLGRLHTAARNRSIREWSIGYRVLAQRTDPDDDDHYFVTEIELLEASLVLRGANPQTGTIAARQHQLGPVPFDPQRAAVTRLALPDGTTVETSDPTVVAMFAPDGPAAVGAGAGAEPEPVTGGLDPAALEQRAALLTRPETRRAFRPDTTEET